MIHATWIAANRRGWRRYAAALDDPMRAQRELLRRIVRLNGSSEFGKRHGFGLVDSIESLRRRVPVTTYADYAGAIERVRRGERGVLTAGRVGRLVPSSGSVGARKLIPWTAELGVQFNAAIGPWIVDLYANRHELRAGPAYWSISPDFAEVSGDADGVVPIGFDDDAAYLGGLMRRVVGRAIVAPSGVRAMRDMDEFRRATAVCLLRCRELRLISVWHPSYLTLLMEWMSERWDELADAAGRGDLRGSCGDWSRVWPRLRVISVWADGHALSGAARLAAAFDGVEVQAKGLLATEAFVSVPFAGRHPLAVRSHVFEFVDDGGRPRMLDEVAVGGEYDVAVTTGGGLYRYRLGDRVRVDAMVGGTPSVRLVGRSDRVSDRCGEKLSEAFVAGVLRGVMGDAMDRGAVRFAMLAPDVANGVAHYTLYAEADGDDATRWGAAIDSGLAANPHYAWCRRLGQLGSVRVYVIRGGGERAYHAHAAAGGVRVGQVKVMALSAEGGWSERFEGQYVGVDAAPAPIFGPAGSASGRDDRTGRLSTSHSIRRGRRGRR